MASFGSTSQARLNTCDHRLVAIFEEVVKIMDCTVLCGERDRQTQNDLFDQGRSKLKYPHSKHNTGFLQRKSLAIDVVPYFKKYPHVRWDDRESFCYFAGIVIGVANSHGVMLTWGNDWNRSFDLSQNNFDDMPHFEIYEE